MIPSINRAQRADVGTTVEAGEIGKEAVTEDKLGPEAVTAVKVKISEIPTLGAASVAFAGKVAFNGKTPPVASTDIGTLSTALSLALLTEVVAALNTTNGKVNEVRTCLRNHGLMA